MRLQGGVPQTFIVPNLMFDHFTGVSMADTEFPVYFNFFVKKGKARIVCTAGQRTRIETVLSEALFGPAKFDIVDEFKQGRETPGFPDLKAEMNYFRRMPASKKGYLDLDDFVEFTVFDERGVASFDNIEIRFGNGILNVLESGRELVSINENDPIIPQKPDRFDFSLNFRPPVFGITTLGAGHGFDPNSSTSGIIIWANRRGIMVDPPVGSADGLQRLGVSPKWIDKVILTHCHADHDAGTLQKILQEGKVNLYTTPTIYSSFLRKSAALTGIEETHLKKLVSIFPVSIGETMMIDEAKFQFNYTLHSIPTISIQASLRGKSMVYSSDTLNDPQYILKLHSEGVLSNDRKDFLLNFPWNRDVILHEAGVPPLHTPLSYLCTLPKETRERTYLVHVNPDLIPPESGLRIAPTGLQNTIELVSESLPHEEAIAIIDAFSNIDLFENLSFGKAREALLVSKVNYYKAGEIIFKKGDPGDKFFVVITGQIDIVLDGRVITTYSVGGFFGEKSIYIEEKRTADAVARSNSKTLCVEKDEMLSLIRGTESEFLLRRIAMFQNVELRNTLACNPIFRSLTPAQQTRLHGFIKPVAIVFPPGETIFGNTDAYPLAFIVKEGSVDVFDGDTLITELSRGGIFGTRNLFPSPTLTPFSYIAKEQVKLYSIDHADLRQFLDKNPGFQIKLFNVSC